MFLTAAEIKEINRHLSFGATVESLLENFHNPTFLFGELTYRYRDRVLEVASGNNQWFASTFQPAILTRQLTLRNLATHFPTAKIEDLQRFLTFLHQRGALHNDTITFL